MPIYSVEHICPLSEEQQDKIAEAITVIHSEKFTTPRLFVNVQFTDISSMNTYVAGKRKKGNRIIANVRSGASRSQDMFDNVCDQINEMWATTVGSSGKQELRAIFMVGGLIAGSEVGFSIPQAGEDAQWLKENIVAFKKKAEGGDEDFQDLMTDLNSRQAFRNILNGTANGH